MRQWQDWLNPVQNRIGGGCNLNRDLTGIIETSGLSVTTLDRYYDAG